MIDSPFEWSPIIILSTKARCTKLNGSFEQRNPIQEQLLIETNRTSCLLFIIENITDFSARHIKHVDGFHKQNKKWSKHDVQWLPFTDIKHDLFAFCGVNNHDETARHKTARITKQYFFVIFDFFRKRFKNRNNNQMYDTDTETKIHWVRVWNARGSVMRYPCCSIVDWIVNWQSYSDGAGCSFVVLCRCAVDRTYTHRHIHTCRPA